MEAITECCGVNEGKKSEFNASQAERLLLSRNQNKWVNNADAHTLDCKVIIFPRLQPNK